MANRSSSSLAIGPQVSFGTALATGLQYLPVSTFRPGISPSQIADDTNTGTRFGTPGKGGTIAAAPSFEANYRPNAYDAYLASLFGAAWSSNVLVQGNVVTYYTLEDRQSDAGSGSYILYQDQRPNSLELRLGLNAYVRSTWGLVGTAVTASGTATTSPIAAASDSPFDTFSGSLTLAGVAVSVTALTVTINNGIEAGYKLFTRTPDRLVQNLDKVSGELTMVYRGSTDLAAVLADTFQALVFVMSQGGPGGGSTGVSQTWSIPAIKFTGWDAPITTGAERLQTVQWEAALNSGTKIQVTRDTTP